MEKKPTVKANAASRSSTSDDVPKKTTTTPIAPRLSTSARTPAVTSTTRTGALSSRTTGTTIDKPPLRPTVAGTATKKPTVAPATNENKRPIRTSAVGTTTSRLSTKPDSSVDTASKRSTVNSTSSAAVRRPVISSRVNAASPTTIRPASRAAVTSAATRSTTAPNATRSTTTPTPTGVRTASTRVVKSPENVRSPAKSTVLSGLDRPIPEESEDSSTAFAGAPGPPKLEIRPNRPFSPTPKAHPQSDAEIDMRPRTATRHSRTQSANVLRPSTAPALSQQEQSMREMEVIQNLLRESTARDILKAENQELKTEVAELEQQNRKLTNELKSHPKFDPDADMSKDRMITEKLTKKHTAELQSLKSLHESDITELRSTHFDELANIRAELDKHRRQNSQLGDVEAKIQAVEQALQESKQQASENEQELQLTIQEKDETQEELKKVIDELKREIDRCQDKLEEDSEQQKKQIMQAEAAQIVVQEQLDTERQQAKTELDRVLDKNKDELENLATQHKARESELLTIQAKLEEQLEEERDRAKATSNQLEADRGTARKLYEAIDSLQAIVNETEQRYKTLQEEIGSERDRIRETIGNYQEELDTLRAGATESEALVIQLEQELKNIRQREDIHSGEHQTALSDLRAKHEASQKAVDSASATILKLHEELQQAQQASASVIEQNKSMHHDLENLKEELRKDTEQALLQKQASEKNAREAATLISRLEAELEIARQATDNTSSDHDKAMEESVSLTRELQNKFDQLNSEYQANTEQHSLRASESEVVVANLRLQLQTFEAEQSKEKEGHERALQGMTEISNKAQQQIKELQKGAEDNRGLTETLQHKIRELHQQQSDIEANHESVRLDSSKVIERLQDEAVKLHQQLHDHAEASKQHASDLAATREASDEMQKQIQEEVAMKEKESSDLKKVVENLHSTIQGLQHDAEERKTQITNESAHNQQVISTLQDELQTMHQKLHDHQKQYNMVSHERSNERELHERLTQQHAESMSHRTELETIRDKQSVLIDALREDILMAKEAKEDADKAQGSLRDELNGLQKVLDTFSQDADEKEDNHQKVVARLRKELDDSKQENEESANVKAFFQNLQSQCDALLSEKSTFEKQLGDITIKHNREMEEESQKHEAAYSDLQTAFARIKDAQNKHVNEEQQQFSQERAELHSTLANLKTDHSRAVDMLVSAHETKLNDLTNSHVQHLRELEVQLADHARISQEQSDRAELHGANLSSLVNEHNQAVDALQREHEHKIQELKESHAASIRKTEDGMAVQIELVGKEIRDEHLRTIEALESEHAEALRKAAAAVEAAETDATEPTQSANNNGGLSHIFVNHVADDTVATRELERNQFQRASDVNLTQELKDAAAENERLRLENASLHHDIASLRTRVDESASLESVNLLSPSRSYTIEDPFADNSKHVVGKSVNKERDGDKENVPMSVEGTLESIRVQAEQLLEVNEDFRLEQRRWSQKLGTRSNRNSPQTKRRPLISRDHSLSSPLTAPNSATRAEF